eukprot:663543-Pyramimonas_sp.AAC.1
MRQAPPCCSTASRNSQEIEQQNAGAHHSRPPRPLQVRSFQGQISKPRRPRAARPKTGAASRRTRRAPQDNRIHTIFQRPKQP